MLVQRAAVCIYVRVFVEAEMKRFVLIIGVVGLLAVDHAYAACPVVNGKPDITSKVYALSSYNPFPAVGSTANTPACSVQANSNDAQLIQNAFKKATPNLQTELCNLTCIFVGSGGAGYSWGKWANPAYGGDGTAVIAIDTSDLNKKYLKDKMNENLLGGITYGKHSVAGDSYAISVMYVLAHELAHIKWRRDFTNGSISANCQVADFTGKSWSSTGTPTNGGRWTAIGDEFGTFNDSNIKHLSHVTNATDLLYIYQHGLVTALGANNPEEEFVETYAIAAIIAADTNVKATLKPNSGSSVLVTDPNFRMNDDLKFKMTQCVFPLLQSLTTDHGYKRSRKRRR
jgi:hypothetical protein